MPSFNVRPAMLAGGLLLAASACNGTGAVPSGAGQGTNVPVSGAALAVPADTTSILKQDKKDVVIGSTVDPTNGDAGPRAVSIVPRNFAKLKKGQVLVCNFNDSSGNAGKGTTIEQFNPTASSKATTFIQSSEIEGCDGDAITTGTQVFATGLTSKVMVWITPKGAIKKTYKSPITDPLGNGDGPPLYLYSPEFIFIGNADTGAMDTLSIGGYGTSKLLEAVNGFPVNSGSGWGALGPGGFGYNSNKASQDWDTLYVADGACNAVVAIQHASNLLDKDEITVQSGCKTFKCLHQSFTCGKLVKSGSPLDAPMAATLLPNGNMIVANTGNDALVELTPSGQVLDTKTIDTGQAEIFGVASTGKNDSSTVVFYTNASTNTLHELEP